MKSLGKRIYLSAEAVEGIESIGRKYIQKFRNGRKTSYNKACLWMLQVIRVAERLKLREPIKEHCVKNYEKE